MYVAVHKSLLTNATLIFANSPLFQFMIPPPHTDFFGDFLYGATHRKLWSTVHSSSLIHHAPTRNQGCCADSVVTGRSVLRSGLAVQNESANSDVDDLTHLSPTRSYAFAVH